MPISWWKGQPCPVCLRGMYNANRPMMYIPPTATPGIYRIMCSQCTAQASGVESLRAA